MEQIENITDMQNKISDYMDILHSFIDFLQQENQALREYDVLKVSDMYTQKVKIVSAYRNMVAFFIKNQSALLSMKKEYLSQIKDISSHLDLLLKENDLLLQTRMETSKSVIGSIVNVAKMTNKSNSTSYGAQGQFNALDNQHSSLAINRTF